MARLSVRHLPCVLALLLPLACNDDAGTDTGDTAGTGTGTGDTGSHDGLYTANIRRTSHGVAHITADNWGSLAFGQAYAFTEDKGC